MGQKRTPAPTMAETINAEGNQVQCTTQESVEAAIHWEISLRFSRAGSAPICNGPLFELLGYNADTEAEAEILEGTFKPPPGTDPATTQRATSHPLLATTPASDLKSPPPGGQGLGTSS